MIGVLGFDSRPELGIFLFTTPPECLWVPPSLLSSGYPGLFPLGVKRPGCEANHSPPSSAEVKECAFMAWYSVKAQELLSLYLLASSLTSQHGFCSSVYVGITRKVIEIFKDQILCNFDVTEVKLFLCYIS
jgi:hypothetical protein